MQQHASAGGGVHVYAAAAAASNNCVLARDPAPARIALDPVPSHSVHASSPSLVPGPSLASLCPIHLGLLAGPPCHTQDPAYHLNGAKEASSNLRAIVCLYRQVVHQVHRLQHEQAK